MRQRKGFAIVGYLIALAVIGVATWIAKPALFPGASKRAADSTKTTAALVSATDAQGASAAASVVKIGEANSVAPESPSRDFIAKEVPATLAKLPAPDPIALLEAERRRSAVMEGRATEAARLYEESAKTSAKLQRERDEALSAKRAVDLALETSAAAEHARTVQFYGAVAVAVLAGALWLYAKLYGISPATLGNAVADIRAGTDPVTALDVHLAPWLHAHVNRAARLATPSK